MESKVSKLSIIIAIVLSGLFSSDILLAQTPDELKRGGEQLRREHDRPLTPKELEERILWYEKDRKKELEEFLAKRLKRWQRFYALYREALAWEQGKTTKEPKYSATEYRMGLEEAEKDFNDAVKLYAEHRNQVIKRHKGKLPSWWVDWHNLPSHARYKSSSKGNREK